MQTGKSLHDASPSAELISQALTVQLRSEYDVAQPYPANIDTLLQRLVCQEIDRETAQERDRIWKLSQDLLMVTDLNGKVVDINPAWSATLGWSADDLVGDTAEWLIHPDDRDHSFRDFVNEAAGNGAPHFQMRILHKNGSYRLLSWLAVRDRELIYAGARDITDLKQTQEKLQALRKRTRAIITTHGCGCADGLYRARNQTASGRDCDERKRRTPVARSIGPQFK